MKNKSNIQFRKYRRRKTLLMLLPVVVSFYGMRWAQIQSFNMNSNSNMFYIGAISLIYLFGYYTLKNFLWPFLVPTNLRELNLRRNEEMTVFMSSLISIVLVIGFLPPMDIIGTHWAAITATVILGIICTVDTLFNSSKNAERASKIKVKEPKAKPTKKIQIPKLSEELTPEAFIDNCKIVGNRLSGLGFSTKATDELSGYLKSSKISVVDVSDQMNKCVIIINDLLDDIDGGLLNEDEVKQSNKLIEKTLATMSELNEKTRSSKKSNIEDLDSYLDKIRNDNELN